MYLNMSEEDKLPSVSVKRTKIGDDNLVDSPIV